MSQTLSKPSSFPINVNVSWRSDDPESNLSDWKIIVSTMSNATAGTFNNDNAKEATQNSVAVAPSSTSSGSATATTTTYNVHKLILGLGPRSSRYFLRVFQNKSLAESQSATSRLELEDSAIKAFPIFLDFIYSTPISAMAQQQAFSTENAVALRYLANYFDVPTLLESVDDFISKDMDKYNIHIYVVEAQKYLDEYIIEATMKVAIEKWNELFINEDGKRIKTPTYLELLPESKKVEVLHKSLLQKSNSTIGFEVEPQPSVPNHVMGTEVGVDAFDFASAEEIPNVQIDLMFGETLIEIESCAEPFAENPEPSDVPNCFAENPEPM